MIPKWSFPHTKPTGRIAEVLLLAFHAGPLQELPFSAETYGLADEAALALVEPQQVANREWTQAWTQGSFRDIAVEDLGNDYAQLSSADSCVLLRATVLDPMDWSYVQAAWALARHAIARGAFCIFDIHAMRFHNAARVETLAPNRVLHASDEIRFVVESVRAGVGPGAETKFVHTRGMRKFARPDLVVLENGFGLDAALAYAKQAATQALEGMLPVDIAATPLGATAEWIDTAPEWAAALQLNNDAAVATLQRLLD